MPKRESKREPTRSGTGGDRWLVGKLLVLTAAMFGFGYLMVPLYDIFCEVTGLGGRTGDQAATSTPVTIDESREIELEFVASVGGHAGWRFRPDVSRMTVTPGQLYRTSFYAENTHDAARVGQAVPSVAPGTAARYLQKTECFCFENQEFAGGEGRDMPVVFFVDPELPDHVDTVTLSYTFFETPRLAGGPD